MSYSAGSDCLIVIIILLYVVGRYLTFKLQCSYQYSLELSRLFDSSYKIFEVDCTVARSRHKETLNVRKRNCCLHAFCDI